MEMLTCEALMATWMQMQARSAEKRTGHRATLSLEEDYYFNHRPFYCCAFLRGGYFAIFTSHHSFEIPFSFSYEFLLCVSYFGRQIDTPFMRWHSMPSDLSSLVLRIFGNAFAARRAKLWKLMAIQERWWRCRFEFSLAVLLSVM